jgi:pilus assembly protein Flp/PilA
VLKQMQAFLKDEDGVTAIEYGLIASLIAIVTVLAVTTAGTTLNTLWGVIGSKLATN